MEGVFVMPKYEDITGKRFGRLVAVKIIKGGRYTKWLCKCDCGKEHIARKDKLVTGRTRSCGCYFIDSHNIYKRNLRHGKSGTKEYRTWVNMLTRCNNPKATNYKDYGGRGIKICEKWLTFEGFWDDMREGYSDKLSLDRIDVNGNYEKSNCRWADKITQANNTRTNHIVSAFGTTDTLANICRKFHVNYSLVRLRLQRNKLDIEEAILKPSESNKFKSSKEAV